MCENMVDIQFATAENARKKEKRKNKKMETTAAKNIELYSPLLTLYIG